MTKVFGSILLGCKHVRLPWGLLTKSLPTEMKRSGDLSFMVTCKKEKKLLKNKENRKKERETVK